VLPRYYTILNLLPVLHLMKIVLLDGVWMKHPQSHWPIETFLIMNWLLLLLLPSDNIYGLRNTNCNRIGGMFVQGI
jgi:hypothetical protein